MNSRTSRPLSPISATTVIGTSQRRASMPRIVDFPTPLPAKIPIRCPLPQARSVSIARTPVPTGAAIRCRRIAGTGG
jgi:hypothetical protein